jgi:tricorn protease
LERDFFYDPNMHGVDWDGVWKQYEPLLDDCVSRADVGFIIREMIAELNVGHAYYRGDDIPDGPSGDTGSLGCRFEADGGAYKIAELFEGAAWDVDARNPLADAGVKAGQYIVAINDQPLTPKFGPYEALVGTQGQTISVTVSDDAKMDDDDKRVAVKPISSDANLRFRAWIEANRKYVSDKTDGKVGYIYVVNTGVPGQNDLVRQLYAQFSKEALIVDDRWNGGGQIPTRFIELLNRPVTNYWALRDGRDWTWPPDSHQGPKCMLINGMAGSGGDMFPALFKQNNLGKLIGMRTWGGLVGISGGPSLVDGTAVTMPSFAYYEKDGTWGIEGHGVDPDIEVVDDPAKMVNGGDPQLDKAIEQMLREIETNGYKAPKRPAYPDRSKFGIEAKDK